MTGNLVKKRGLIILSVITLALTGVVAATTKVSGKSSCIQVKVFGMLPPLRSLWIKSPSHNHRFPLLSVCSLMLAIVLSFFEGEGASSDLYLVYNSNALV